MRKAFPSLIAASLGAIIPLVSSAQLVADGGTNILDTVPTTVTGNVSVGTNTPFTFLTLTNGATVTNTGIAYIGQNGTAKSNAVVVTGTGSIWDAPGGFYVGYLGDANALNILAGGKVTNQFAYIGAFANSNSVVVSGTNSFWNMQWTRTGQYGSLRVGSSGAGNTLVITNGGKVADGFAYIGENSSAAGNSVIVTGAGSTWSHLNSSFDIGYNGSGNGLMITNGGAVTGGFANVGFQGDSNRVVVAGTNSIWTNNGLTLGAGGNSAFNEVLVNAGGTLSVGGVTSIGQYNTSNIVRITDPGTRWTNASYIDVGYGGRGNQLIVSNGAVVTVDYTHVEANGGSQNKVTVTGAGSLLTNRADFYLGFSGSSNQLLVADGGKLVNNIGYIGYGGFNAISNQAVITGANSVWTNRSTLYIGYNDARSLLVISNGAKVFNELGILGQNSNGSNQVLVTDLGSLWSSRQELIVGSAANGNQLTVNNAGTVVALSLSLGNPASSSNNLLTVDGGNVIVTNSSAGFYVWRGTVTLNSGLIQVYRLQMNNGPAGKFIFKGGTLRIVGANVNNGLPFIVGDGINQATLDLLPTGSHTFAQGLVISSNALLQGFGTVFGNVSLAGGGAISPGTTNLASLSVSGDFTLTNGSIARMKLKAIPATDLADRILCSGNVRYGGTLQLTNLSGTFADGMSFTLFTGSSFTGAFSNLSPAVPGPGLKWNTNRLNVDGVLRVFNLHAAPPAIASVERSANDVLIHATGGIPYDPCFVLTSTNLIDWQYSTTNAFDAGGTVTITNFVSLDESARFFRLQVE